MGLHLQDQTAGPHQLFGGFYKRGRVALIYLVCLLQKFSGMHEEFYLMFQIRELSAGLLLRYFPASFPDDIAAVLLTRTKQLLCSPRVQEAQMGALMMKVLLQK